STKSVADSLSPDQSESALNSVIVFTDGVEKVALQQAPDEVLSCAMTLGLALSGREPRSGLLMAFTCSFASSGVVEPLSRMLVMPSGAPVALLNLHPVAVCVHPCGGITHGEPASASS